MPNLVLRKWGEKYRAIDIFLDGYVDMCVL